MSKHNIILLTLCAFVVLCGCIITGCSQYEMKMTMPIFDPNDSSVIIGIAEVHAKANHLFDDREFQDLDLVWPDGSYLAAKKVSSKTSPEWLQMIQTLNALGMLRVPVPEPPQ